MVLSGSLRRPTQVEIDDIRPTFLEKSDFETFVLGDLFRNVHRSGVLTRNDFSNSVSLFDKV